MFPSSNERQLILSWSPFTLHAHWKRERVHGTDAKIAALRKKNEEIERRQKLVEAEAAEQARLDQEQMEAEKRRIREEKAQQRRKQREERDRQALQAYEEKRRQNIEAENKRQALIAEYEEHARETKADPVMNQSLRGRQNVERKEGPSRRAHARKKGGMLSAKEQQWKAERAQIDAERMARQTRVDENGNRIWTRVWDHPDHKVDQHMG
eukprot:m.78565 g.78565  ORF g.78565 m.78565 type:complete len:210 (-) comp14120_c1_seq1:719-1348(-)